MKRSRARKRYDPSQAALIVQGWLGVIAACVLVAAVSALTSVNFAAFRVLGFVPVGAFVCGLLSVFPYQRACRKLNRPPGRDAWMHLINTGLAFTLLAWWIHFALKRTSDGVAYTAQMPWLTFLHESVTRGRGDWAYGLLMIDWAGFVAGGALGLSRLQQVQRCEECGKYMKRSGRISHRFPNEPEFHSFFEKLQISVPFEREYLALMQSGRGGRFKSEGAYRYEFILMSCPACGTEILRELGATSDGQRWHPVARLDRTLSVPPRHRMKQLFRERS
jgi:hypothetical protein